MQDFNWNDLRYILAVYRTHSFAMAARRLGVNESTVGRRISHVESQLEARLFERSTSGLMPTAAGIKAYEIAERVEHQTQSMLSKLSGADKRVSGNVRLTSVPIILNHLVVPAIPHLISNYPELGIEVVAESKNLSLTRRHADIAIRLSRPIKEPQIVTRKIGSLDYAIYGNSQNKHDLLPWINYEDEMVSLPQAQWMLKQIKNVEHLSQVKLSDAESILSYLKSGFGKSLLPTFVGDNETGITRLSSEIVLSREVWLLVHPDIKDFGHIRKTMDWLISLFESY